LKFSKIYNGGISLNWCIIDEVTTRNTTAYFFNPLYVSIKGFMGKCFGILQLLATAALKFFLKSCRDEIR